MAVTHQYSLSVDWTGNRGEGTIRYTGYDRAYSISTTNKPMILGSSDPAFRGDPNRYNPEELLLASISSCHLLWYLHLCAVAGVVVMEYRDEASGTMTENADGGGRFSSVALHPVVVVSEASMIPRAIELHARANSQCFIANSLNFPVRHFPEITAADSLL